MFLNLVVFRLVSIPANLGGSEIYQVLSNINFHFSNTIFGVISWDSSSAADCQDFSNEITFLSLLTFSEIRSFLIWEAQR